MNSYIVLSLTRRWHRSTRFDQYRILMPFFSLKATVFLFFITPVSSLDLSYSIQAVWWWWGYLWKFYTCCWTQEKLIGLFRDVTDLLFGVPPESMELQWSGWRKERRRWVRRTRSAHGCHVVGHWIHWCQEVSALCLQMPFTIWSTYIHALK